eukprot:TRINITY_DN14957_c0_g1_i1.p1 TRINITY_DN14957_c0_g1~~TRINITY_DN14957_c0_g1_i1.p1  ORF type:complete len:190 (-),score=9.77 TRINITY_DN14957_c0_g1_i1:9-578(-)
MCIRDSNFVRNDNITDLGIEYIAQSLSLLQKLSNLSLSINECKKLTRKSLKSIINRIPSLSALDSLSLGLLKGWETDYLDIFDSRRFLLSNIKIQELRIIWCPRSDDECCNMAREILALRSLTSLQLIFGYSNERKNFQRELRKHSELSIFNRDSGSSDRVMKVMSTICLLYTSPSPRDRQKSRMPSSA